MKDLNRLRLEAPRMVSGRPLLIAGLRGHFTPATWAAISDEWQRFVPYLGKIPGEVVGTTYGLCFNMSEGVDYLCCVEVSALDRLPGEFSHASVPPQTYAVFAHREHVSKLRNTLDAIQREWLPESGCHVAQATAGAPDFFERYGAGFDPQTGMGDVEVWIPVAVREQRDSGRRLAS